MKNGWVLKSGSGGHHFGSLDLGHHYLTGCVLTGCLRAIPSEGWGRDCGAGSLGRICGTGWRGSYNTHIKKDVGTKMNNNSPDSPPGWPIEGSAPPERMIRCRRRWAGERSQPRWSPSPPGIFHSLVARPSPKSPSPCPSWWREAHLRPKSRTNGRDQTYVYTHWPREFVRMPSPVHWLDLMSFRSLALGHSDPPRSLDLSGTRWMND